MNFLLLSFDWLCCSQEMHFEFHYSNGKTRPTFITVKFIAKPLEESQLYPKLILLIENSTGSTIWLTEN